MLGHAKPTNQNQVKIIIYDNYREEKKGNKERIINALMAGHRYMVCVQFGQMYPGT